MPLFGFEFTVSVHVNVVEGSLDSCGYVSLVGGRYVLVEASLHLCEGVGTVVVCVAGWPLAFVWHESSEDGFIEGNVASAG